MSLTWTDISGDDRTIYYATIRNGHYYVVMSQPSSEAFAAFYLEPDDFSFLRNQKSLEEAKTACATHAETGHWTPRTQLSDIDRNAPLDEQRRAVRRWMTQGAREYFCNHPREWKGMIEALAGKPLGGPEFVGFEADTARLEAIAREAVTEREGA